MARGTPKIGEKRRTLRLNFPIDAASRALVDAENERMRHCIIPIITEKSGRPFLVGSAVAIRHRDCPCLATAHHVLEDNKDNPLGIFGADGNSIPFGGTFNISELHDLAVTLLEPALAASLSHIPFLDSARIGSVADVDGRFYASVAGYPHTASRRRDKLTLETPMEIFSDVAHEEAGDFVSVFFNKKEGARSATGHGQARDQQGKSGGAIFGMRLTGLAIVPDQPASLIGIATTWKRGRNRIRGAGARVLMELLEAAAGSD